MYVQELEQLRFHHSVHQCRILLTSTDTPVVSKLSLAMPCVPAKMQHHQYWSPRGSIAWCYAQSKLCQPWWAYSNHLCSAAVSKQQWPTPPKTSVKQSQKSEEGSALGENAHAKTQLVHAPQRQLCSSSCFQNMHSSLYSACCSVYFRLTGYPNTLLCY